MQFVNKIGSEFQKFFNRLFSPPKDYLDLCAADHLADGDTIPAMLEKISNRLGEQFGLTMVFAENPEALRNPAYCFQDFPEKEQHFFKIGFLKTGETLDEALHNDPNRVITLCVADQFFFKKYLSYIQRNLDEDISHIADIQKYGKKREDGKIKVSLIDVLGAVEDELIHRWTSVPNVFRHAFAEEKLKLLLPERATAAQSPVKPGQQQQL